MWHLVTVLQQLIHYNDVTACKLSSETINTFNQIISNYDDFKDDLEDFISEALTDSVSIYLNNIPFFPENSLLNNLNITTNKTS